MERKSLLEELAPKMKCANGLTSKNMDLINTHCSEQIQNHAKCGPALINLRTVMSKDKGKGKGKTDQESKINAINLVKQHCSSNVNLALKKGPQEAEKRLTLELTRKLNSEVVEIAKKYQDVNSLECLEGTTLLVKGNKKEGCCKVANNCAVFLGNELGLVPEFCKTCSKIDDFCISDNYNSLKKCPQLKSSQLKPSN